MIRVKGLIFQLFLKKDHIFFSKITEVILSIHIFLEKKMLLHLLVRNCLGFAGSSENSFDYKEMTKLLAIKGMTKF